MESKIVVVHRSEIVRKGLAAVLNPIWKSDILQSESMDEFISRGYSRTCRTLVFLDAEMKDHAAEIPGSSTSVLVYDSCPVEGNPESGGSVHLRSGYEIFQQIVARFKSGNPSGGLPENELTQREMEVLRQVAMGYSNKEIADSLHISIHTVITHRKNITGKLGIKSISGLTVYAIINHLIDPDQIDMEKLI